MMDMVYHIRKSRGINWTHEEKECLVELCCKRARIIEDKRSDVHTLRKKAIAWKAVYDKFSAKFGRKRPPVRVKEQWKRMKIAARAEMRSKQKTEQEVTSGIVDLAEGDGSKSKYCMESEELLSQVQAVLNSEYPDADDVDDSAVDMNGMDADEPIEPVIIKVESDIEEVENSSHDYYGADLSNMSSLSNRYDEFGTHRNSTPVPINVLQVTNQSPRQYTELQHHANESWDMYNTKTDPSRNFRKYSASEPMAVRNHVTKIPSSSISYNSLADGNKYSKEILANYAKREHIRKMEIMEKEHQTKMEILKIEREIAIKKLRKAELKLTLNGLSNV